MVRVFALPLGAWLLICGAPALAQNASLTADDALANYRDMTRVDDAAATCNRNADSDEIIVCGKDDSAKHRLPLPNERGPRDGARRATGEVAAASAAPVRTGSCGTLTTDTGCTGGLPVIGAAILVAQAIGKVIEGDE